MTTIEQDPFDIARQIHGALDRISTELAVIGLRQKIQDTQLTEAERQARHIESELNICRMALVRIFSLGHPESAQIARIALGLPDAPGCPSLESAGQTHPNTPDVSSDARETHPVQPETPP